MVTELRLQVKLTSKSWLYRILDMIFQKKKKELEKRCEKEIHFKSNQTKALQINLR